MGTEYLAQLEACGWSATSGPEQMACVERLESRIGVLIPSDFCDFLTSIGPGYLDAWAPCNDPTPFGDHGITSIHSVPEIEELLDSVIVPRNMICIGTGDFEAITCLSICGLDRGAVYSFDGEMNFFKDIDGPQQFYANSPLAKEFYRMRDADELPQRPWGYENCYLVADSFTEFLAKIRPDNGDDQEATTVDPKA